MLPSLRYASIKDMFAAAFAVPRQALSGLWYRMYGWNEPPLRRHVPVLESITSEDERFKRIAFTFSVIALSAKIAGVGGSLSKGKYVAFREVFPLSGEICGKIRALFALAYENPTGFEHYVTQIKYAFPGQVPLFESVVDRLFRIAVADGDLPREAEFMLAKVAHILEITPGSYSRIRDAHISGAPDRQLFDRQKGEQLKGRYRELMKRYHPDKFAAETVSPEVEMLLQLKTSEINETYRRLSKKAA